MKVNTYPVYMMKSEDVPMSSDLLSIDLDVAGYYRLPGTEDIKPIIVRQSGAGEFLAFSAVCPHAQCTVEVLETTLRCPCHGSRFDLKSGKVTVGPAVSDLENLKVTLERNQIFISVPTL